MTMPQNEFDPQGQPYQPYQPPQPAKHRSKPRWGLWIGIIVAAILTICVGCTAGAALISEDSDSKPRKGTTVVTPSVTGPTTPALPAAPASPARNDEPDTPDTFDLKLGTTVSIVNDDGIMEVTVSRNKTYPKARKTACKEYMPKPDRGLYVVLDVKMEVKTGFGSINPLYFTYVAGDGTTDEGVGGLFSGCGKGMDSGNEMRAGTKRTGQLVFDTSDPKGTVEFAGNVFSGPQASWKVG